jgi:hypothetical protein
MAPDTKTTTHTPGPWSVFDDEIVADRTDRHVCTVDLEDGIHPSEWQANQRLIAAAPELLLVARAAFHALKSYQYGNVAPDLAAECCDAIAAALAKAEGRDR